MSYRHVSSFLASLAVLAAPLAAHATTCTTDGDCPSGYHCADVPAPPEPTPACDPSGTCPDAGTTTPSGTTTRECQYTPQTCTTDADCPSYLRCVASGGVGCASSGSTGTGSPAPSTGGAPTVDGCDAGTFQGPMICQFVPIACTSDADCATGFQCADNPEQVCSVEACPAGQTCNTQPTCMPADPPKVCTLKQTTCTTAADCPSTWNCQTVTNGGDCALSGPTSPAGGSAGSTSSTCPAPTTMNVCIPPGFEPGGGIGLGDKYGNGTGAPAESAAGGSTGTSGAAPSGSSASSNDSGGCAFGGTGASSLWLVPALAAIAAGVARRRRR